MATRTKINATPKTEIIAYTITPKNPAAHLWEVSVTVNKPNPDGQIFRLPTWIPGSYMIREFSRHIISLTARCGKASVAVEKIDKHSWQCARGVAGALTLTYEVYAWDLSVRASHLDDTHGFFNGTSVFLMVEGFRDAPCELLIKAPSKKSMWKIATALPQGPIGVGRSKRTSVPKGALLFGTFHAANYDELIDHPVEMGDFTYASFLACGATHHIAITGRHRCDTARLVADLKRICDAQIRFFEPSTHTPPMQDYWFLIMAVGEGFGGLEHRASTALLACRDDLPSAQEAHQTRASTGYRRFLSLASHEYFHTWNVKRIKPAGFMHTDLFAENYTRQLWFFEGITDYYDDLFLSRAGIITPLEYLEIEAENIGRVHTYAGRHQQSVAESSFDAWVKYYRQDENAPNAIVSYYQKGSIVGLALDLTIRNTTGGKKSLDDVMRALWRDYGKKEIGVPEGLIEAIASQVAGVDLSAFFATAVYGKTDIDLTPIFASVAIDFVWKHPTRVKPEDPIPASFGARIGSEGNGDAKLMQVFTDGAAQRAGLSAGDAVLAVDGLRVNAGNMDTRLRSYAVGEVIAVLASRRDEIKTFLVTLQEQGATLCSLTTQASPAVSLARREAWLLGG